MSKARSPREVCSTTIGIRGLIVRALYRRRSADSPRGRRSLVARSPKFARRFLLALRGEDLLSRLGFLGAVVGFLFGDRFGRVGDQLDLFLRHQVFLDHLVAAVLTQAL